MNWQIARCMKGLFLWRWNRVWAFVIQVQCGLMVVSLGEVNMSNKLSES